MDPGLGLIVNSMAPSEAEALKLSPKSTLQLPSGFFEKPHVRHALKYMANDEQREEALQVAMAWKEKFRAKRWKPVLAAIEIARKEDSLRTSAQDGDFQSIIHPSKRLQVTTTASAPVVPQVINQTTPARIPLIRQHTASASLPLRHAPAANTPRSRRWDVITSDPVTPLSPVLIGNSFSSGGFWSPSTTQIERYEKAEHVAAVDPEFESPLVLQSVEAIEVYSKLKKDVDSVARKFCLARFKTETSGNDDFVPDTLIKPKDIEAAARTVLNMCNMKLQDAFITDLPEKLQRWALREAELRSRFCIKDEADIFQQNDWMNSETLMIISAILDKEDYLPPPIHLAVSVLDEQREAFRMFRIQRAADLEMEDPARDAAWVVRILEDAERLVASEVDVWSNDSGDDGGYSYSNFLRSIRSEMSTSTGSGALSSMVQELSNHGTSSSRSQSSTYRTSSSFRNRDSSLPPRSSISPASKKSRSRLSDLSLTSSNHKHSTSLTRRRDLHITTQTIDEISASELTPEDRMSRHRGPGLADLNYWAEELKRMDSVRAEQKQVRRQALHSNPISRDTVEALPNDHTPRKRTTYISTNPRRSLTSTLHSRFSFSSSSAESGTSKLSPCPSYATSLAKATSRPTMLDHEYHQHNLGKVPATTHRQSPTTTPLPDSMRPFQHLRSTSSASRRTNVTKAEREDWMNELTRMESRERMRQSNERQRAFLALGGDE